MGRIVMSENVSLDGVIQDPAGDEGFARGGWVGRIAALPELAKFTLDEALGTEALLLGRRSYEWFAARWPSRSGDLADRLNSLPKYVVSSTLEDPDWTNTTVLNGDVVNEVSKLKQERSGEINVPASFQLARTLMEHDLVDELRLKIFPVVLGAGERLFGETSDKKPMRLVDTQTVGDGVAILTYEPVRDAERASDGGLGRDGDDAVADQALGGFGDRVLDRPRRPAERRPRLLRGELGSLAEPADHRADVGVEERHRADEQVRDRPRRHLRGLLPEPLAQHLADLAHP